VFNANLLAVDVNGDFGMQLINPPVAGIKGNVKEAVTNAVIENDEVLFLC
jgi:hypothetical protein